MNKLIPFLLFAFLICGCKTDEPYDYENERTSYFNNIEIETLQDSIIHCVTFNIHLGFNGNSNPWDKNQTGADAIKLQTYTADTITLDCDNEYFQIKQDTLWDGQSLYSLYKEAYMPWEWQAELKTYAESLGLVCFSSPFDKTAVDFLEELKVPAYKIASFELFDTKLIEYAASKGSLNLLSLET